MLAAPGVSQRQLAKVAGLLVSIRPAVYMAPLYSKSLFQGLRGQWDGPVSEFDRAFAREDLLYWRDNLAELQGKSWVRRETVYTAFGDASDTAYAGSSELLQHPMVIGHSAAELTRRNSKAYLHS